MKEDRLIKGYGSTHPMKWLFFSIMIYKIIQVLNIWRNYRKINVHQNRRQTKKNIYFEKKEIPYLIVNTFTTLLFQISNLLGDEN